MKIRDKNDEYLIIRLVQSVFLGSLSEQQQDSY